MQDTDKAFEDWCHENGVYARTSYLLVWRAACKWKNSQLAHKFDSLKKDIAKIQPSNKKDNFALQINDFANEVQENGGL